MRISPASALIRICIVLAVAGAMVLYMFGKDSAAYSKGVTDFNEMTESDFIADRYVDGTIYSLEDEFAYEEEYNETLGIKHNESVSAHYYVMPLFASYETETPQYIAVCLRNPAMIETAEQMVNETWDFYETGEEPEEWTSLFITGKVSKLDGELKDLMLEWMMYGDEEGSPSDYEAFICPYLITYNDPSTLSTGKNVGGVIFGIGAAGLVIMLIVWLKARGNQQTQTADGFSAPMEFPTAADTGYAPVNEQQQKTSPVPNAADEDNKLN